MALANDNKCRSLGRFCGGMKLADELISDFREAQAKLVVQTADLPLGTLADMVHGGAIDLQPGFQRRERWSSDKQSALIESFLLNVPVPPVYLAEEADGTYTAIDGKQRLRAITDFLRDQLVLRRLEGMQSANGVIFSKLPEEIKNSLRLRPYLRVVTLLKQTDPSLKYEVFLRLNRGGESLNAQEIRNVAFRGPLNNLVYELSQNGFLRNRLKIENEKSSAYKEMLDAEFVLRFLTLIDHLDDFSGSLVREMDAFMRLNQFEEPNGLAGMRASFEGAMDRVSTIWGEHAFHRPEGDGWRDQALAGLFDAQMLASVILTQPQYNRAVERREQVIQATRELFNDEDFDKSVRTGTNTPNRIRYRFEQTHNALLNA